MALNSVEFLDSSLASAFRSAHPPARARGGLSGGARRADPALDGRLHRQGAVDADRLRGRRLDRLLVRGPAPRRAAAADALEPAGRAARARLLDPRAPGRGARQRPETIRSAAVMLEVNELAATLHDQRLGALEAGALLRTVMVEIDVAVFTFDGAHALRLVNRAGERLLAAVRRPAARARRPQDLGLHACLEGQTPRIEDVVVPRRLGPLGSAADDVSPGGAAAPAARARRRQPAAARRRASGLAAPDPRDRPRDQQFAGAHQVDRRQPRVDARARTVASRVAGRSQGRT